MLPRLLSILLVLVASSVLQAGLAPGCTAQEVTVPLNVRLREANTRFSFKLLGELAQNQTTENLFVSPLSLSVALLSLYGDAPVPTRRAVASALELGDLSLDRLPESTAFLQSTLVSPDSRLEIALTSEAGAGVLPAVRPVQNRSQSAPSQVATIQRPVSLKVGAEFRGPWSLAFAREQTREQPFTLSDGKQKNVEMMSRVGIYRYAQTRDFQAINLPYGKNGLWSMVIFLPSPGTPLRNLFRTLDGQWERWNQQLAVRDGTIELPRFKIDYDRNLAPALKAVGFIDDPAGPVRLGELIHRASIQVTEPGLITSRTSTDNSVLPPALRPKLPPFVMRVDRPFFFVVHDNTSGLILFVGSVIDPTL